MGHLEHPDSRRHKSTHRNVTQLPEIKNSRNVSLPAKSFRSVYVRRRQEAVSIVPQQEDSEVTVELMLKYNQETKAQILEIVETLEGKIQRAKERKAEKLASDPDRSKIRSKHLNVEFT